MVIAGDLCGLMRQVNYEDRTMFEFAIVMLLWLACWGMRRRDEAEGRYPRDWSEE